MQSVAPEDFRTRIPEIEARALIIQGGKDIMVPNAGAQWTYENLSGEKEIILYEESGHLPFVEPDQKRFNADVKAFLELSS